MKNFRYINSMLATRDVLTDLVAEAEAEEFNPNYSYTENGALGYKSSKSSLVDINYAVTSLRNKDASATTEMFRKAYGEDPEMALRWLFFARDVRGGMGERLLFRRCLTDMVVASKGGLMPLIAELVPLVAEYGRYDDVLCLLNTDARKIVADYLHKQLVADEDNMINNKPISLLAKWMPSEQASANETKHYAHILMEEFGMTPKAYRKKLSALRKYLVVLEGQMSANEWEKIDYNKVPSKANLLYKDAFIRHDSKRREDFLNSLITDSNSTKINASVAYPYEVVHSLMEKIGCFIRNSRNYERLPDTRLEQAMWNALPECNLEGDVLVVADGSGSMSSSVSRKTSVSAWEVAHSLAIYFAQHNRGKFRDNYITFSEHPQFVSLKGKDIVESLRTASKHFECANTNIERVFDLILSTAVNNHYKQSDIPSRILVVSDMEFDCCACDNSHIERYTRCGLNSNLFKVIGEKYAKFGYKLPRLVFWNVCSRTTTIPMTENEFGVALVSGFSPNIYKMIMSDETDPLAIVNEAIMAERYDPISDAYNRYLDYLDGLEVNNN